jgi:hypothetical protein
MKSLLAILGVSLGLVLAVPAHSEPGLDEPAGDENNGSFIADLKKVGIGFSDPAISTCTATPQVKAPETRRRPCPKAKAAAAAADNASRLNRLDEIAAWCVGYVSRNRRVCPTFPFVAWYGHVGDGG